MLKFPIGWAERADGKRTRPMVTRATRTPRRHLALLRVCIVLYSAGATQRVQKCESFACHAGVHNVKVRIGFQRQLEIPLCFIELSGVLVNHSRMEIEKGVSCAACKRMRHGLGGLFWLSVLIVSP